MLAGMYLVSLDRDADRRERLKRQAFFRARGFLGRYGVDGRGLEWEKFSSSSRSGGFLAGRDLSPGEVGCSLSHLEIYKKAGTHPAGSCVAIFEDDAVDSSQSELLFLNAVETIDENGLIVLGCQDGLKLYAFWKLLWGINFFITGKLIMGVPKFLSRRLYRTTAYLISLQVADAILMESRRGLRCADDYHGHVRDTRCNLYFCPAFGHPKDLSESRIENERS